MRHRNRGRHLNRTPDHRRSLFRNLSRALFTHESIVTTVPKAKELRPFVERLITIAKRGVAAGDANGRALSARRHVLAELPDEVVVGKLFDTIVSRFAERPGGYTRILRLGIRRGDAAEVAQIELVGSEYNPRAAEAGGGDKEAAKPKKGVGDRLKAAAQRMRGKKDTGGSKAQARGQTRGAARKSTTPRKAGGS
jgi:large subunit ribosomal protein L17